MSNTFETIFKKKTKDGTYVFCTKKPVEEQHDFNITCDNGELVLTIPEDEDISFKDAIEIVKDLFYDDDFKTTLSVLAGTSEIKSITYVEKGNEEDEENRKDGGSKVYRYSVSQTSDVLELLRTHFENRFSLHIPKEYTEEQIAVFINRLNFVREELIRLFEDTVVKPFIRDNWPKTIFCSSEERTKRYNTQFTQGYKEFVQAFVPSEDTSAETQIYIKYLQAFDAKDIGRQKELIEELKNLSQE